MPAVETQNLTKVYTTHKKAPGMAGAVKGLFTREKVVIEAVRNVSLSIEQGELIGFLGPNGAGKTTTLKILSGILFPTSGVAKVLGYTPSERRGEMLRQIALVMGNKQQLWWDLPAWESFLVLKELYEVPDAAFKRRVDALVTALQLQDKINTQVRRLSLGERMKCELVAALLHAPKVVFLDEPTIGLDVVSQKRIREFLLELHKEDGNTILLTSHYMQDVQEVCRRVIVIDHGSIVFDGSLDALARKFEDVRQLRFTFDQPIDVADVARYGRVVRHDETSAVIEAPSADTAKVASQVLASFPVNDLAIEEVDVEEVIRRMFTTDRQPLSQ
ncbi:MAG: ATP-binding cassette domain-containing protein [Fimbriimonadaceae bacterium]